MASECRSVFEEARSIAAALERLVARLEPGTLDATGAKKLVNLFTTCERLSIAGRGMAARRVETALSWKREEHRSAAHWLASTTGVSVGAAARSLQTARELEALPATAAAFRSGELSEAQASEIAATATLDPNAERPLLDSARSAVSFKGLRDQCRDASIRARDDEAHARSLHRTRAVNTWKDRDGAWRMDVRLAPDDGAFVASGARGLDRQARPRGGPRPARAAAGVCGGRAGRAGQERSVQADRGASRRQRMPRSSVGTSEPGERCELAGIGPIPVTIARSLSSDARVTVLAREAGEITELAPPKRTIPAKLRRRLEAAYPVCGVEGCDVDHGLQIDHITPVEEHGPTNPENTWRICTHHHKLKTFYRWNVVGPPGARRLVPPEDPDPP